MDVCLVLPSSAREECDTLITNYGQAIVDILVSELTPSQLCPELGLCPKALEVSGLLVLVYFAAFHYLSFRCVANSICGRMRDLRSRDERTEEYDW